MKTIYREEISRKKLPAVLILFVFFIIQIIISDAVQRSVINGVAHILINLTVVVLMIAVGYILYRKCIIKFRYSIIMDQLIVHRLKNNDQIVVENIKISNINDISKCGRIKYLLAIRKHGGYLQSFLNGKIYCCTYLVGSKTQRFFFQPSENFSTKIEQAIKNEKSKHA